MKKLLRLAPLALVVLGALAGCSKSREHLNPYDASGPDLKYVKPWTVGTWRAGEYRDDGFAPDAVYYSNPGSTNENISAFVGSSKRGVALLSFDTNDFPANSRLIKATFVFKPSCRSTKYKISTLDAPFDVSTVWATIPSATYLASYVSEEIPVPLGYRCAPNIRIDITSLYQAWLDGTPNNGLIFECDTGTTYNDAGVTSVSVELIYHLK